WRPLPAWGCSASCEARAAAAHDAPGPTRCPSASLLLLVGHPRLGQLAALLAEVAVDGRLEQLAPADLVGPERFRAVLDQAVRPHVVVGADDVAAERVDQREGAVAAVARPEEVAHRGLELPVAQPLVEEVAERLLLLRSDVEDVAPRPRLLEQRVVLLVICHARVVEDDDARRMPVVPEVLVVGCD